VLAGDGLIWVADRGRHRAVLRADGGAIGEIHRWRPAAGEAVDLVASGQTVALQRWRYRCTSRTCRRWAYEELLAGGVVGPLRRVAACGLPGAPACRRGCPSADPPTVSGRALAWRFACDEPLRVRDEQGRERSVKAGPGAQIAGGYVASYERHAAGGGVVVRDLASGVERLRVRGSIRFYDLDVDGGVAFGTQPTGNRATTTDVWVASPAAPTARHLDQLSGDAVPSIAGNLVAYAGEDLDAVPQVRVVRRDGSRVAAGAAPGRDRTSPVSFDGQQVSWRVRPCQRVRLATWSLVGSPPGQRSGCGRLAVRRMARLTANRRELRVPIACPTDPPGGCFSRIRASLRQSGRRAVRLAETALALEPGARSAIELRLTRRSRRVLRRSSVLRLEVRDGGSNAVPRRFRLRVSTPR